MAGSSGRRTAWVLLATVVAIAGCAEEGECTLIGAISQVRFELGDVARLHPGALSAQACIETACQQVTVAVGSPPQFSVPSDKLSEPVDVSLRVTAGDQVVFAGAAAVTAKESRPNGPGCDPVVHQATVVATGADTLTVSPAP